MKKVLYSICILFFITCGESHDSSTVEDNWTKGQKIHLYNDCKEKLLGAGESDESAHEFCECVLLKVVAKYSDGKEAMENLGDAEIEAIDQSCLVILEE